MESYSKQFAERYMSQYGESLWKKHANGATIGGYTLYEYFLKEHGYSADNQEKAICLLHWVAAAGIGSDNKFQYLISNSKMGC